MTTLTAGDKAPDFANIPDQDGNKVSLADYKGKKLAIFFYPRDMTPTCTNQACNLRDNFGALQKAGIEILGVNDDPESKHQKFIDKHSLPFPLLADTERQVLQSYGVWGPKKFMGKEFDGTHRTTFLIGEDGNIVDVIKKVKAKEHDQQVLEGFGLS